MGSECSHGWLLRNPTQIIPPNRRNPPQASPRPARGLPPLEPSAYAVLLRAASSTRCLELGKLARSHMIRAAYGPGLFLWNNLLAVYCCCSDTRHARLLLDRMPRRDTVSWNTLVAGYSSLGSARLALDAFRDARGSGVGVDRFTYAAVLAACARGRDGRNGRAAHGLAGVSALARSTFLTNSIIDTYAKLG